ncbi:MAG TPA: NUDIX domain-containing protein [Patescibacteria group bacterium]|nr:NUDIX domain-containing protein [Patescibacteria group bacterium]
MNLQVGVKALIKNSQDEYLFMRRSTILATDVAEPSWDIPGGRIEPDEYLPEALKREVQEEIGHEIQSTPVLIAAQDIFVPAKELHVVRLTYMLNEDVDDITLSEEHEEYVWVHESQLETVNAEPYLAEVLMQLREQLTLL